MRIAIREQLTLLILIAVLVALAIVSIPTWIYVNRFVLNVTHESLSLTASLKASRIAAELELLQQSCLTISSRILVQDALRIFYQGEDNSTTTWDKAKDDIVSALSMGSLTGLLQAKLYSRNTTGGNAPLLSATAKDLDIIKLPYGSLNDSSVAPTLSDTIEGYPRDLYPNITYIDLQRPNPFRPDTPAFAAQAFDGVYVSHNQGLVLGPLIINSTYALVSLSVPIRDNVDGKFILGYMTIVATASSLIDIRDSREGLGNSGMMLLLGPRTPYNRFDASLPASNATYIPPRDRFGDVPVRFVVPVSTPPSQDLRHNDRNMDNNSMDNNYSFPVRDYPAVFTSFSTQIYTVNNASAEISTTNEQGIAVAVGFARTSTSLVNWTVVVEQSRGEAYVPIDNLRNILLATVFGTVGLIVVLILPCAHLSVLPIRRLKVATEKTIAPPGYDDGYYDSEVDGDDEASASGGTAASHHSEKKGIVATVKRFVRRKAKGRPGSDHGREATRRTFKIPGKVEDKSHIFTDELTELTKTFNDMSDELVRQYSSLDEKVAERTRELEISKKAAEAANESKTLFIANISHELKTPLNGILGMCAVCMEESDILRIKHSLKTLYKSGDLLLHLLEDLLSFSKNQIGQQLSLEEKEFKLVDIRSQILTIFDKQVREGKINFAVNFAGQDIANGGPVMADPPTDNTAPETTAVIGLPGTGRLADMCLWGDQHRVLQVIINLVSNSLKFTPAGGMVTVRIKCLGEVERVEEQSRASSSLRSSNRLGRSRKRVGSASSTPSQGNGSMYSQYKVGTAIAINPAVPKSTPHIHVRERSPTPPPASARPYLFEFEVEDTGPGIAEHMQTRVFEPFVQGDLGLSKRFGGTGLGLSICQQLASLMGGKITLRSAVGVGSTFTMRIPLKYVRNRVPSTASNSISSRPASVEVPDAEAQRVAAAALAKSNEVPKSPQVLDPQPRLVGLSQPFFASNPGSPKRKQSAEVQMAAIENAMAKKEGQGKLRVLVADDNSTNVEVVSRMLKLEANYDVTIAKDGQEAYDLVKKTMQENERFDLIFMDIQMPNLDGLQSTRLIRKMGYKSPIVALTAFSEESNVQECMECGMDEFLSKPIRRPALKQVLKKFATIPEEDPEPAAGGAPPPPNHRHSTSVSSAINGGVEASPGNVESIKQTNGPTATLSTPFDHETGR